MVEVKFEMEVCEGGGAPCISVACRASAPSLTFNASAAFSRNCAIVASFSTILPVKSACQQKQRHCAVPADWKLGHAVAATTKTALQGRGTVHRKNASQLVHGTSTGSFIWKLTILASQIRERHVGQDPGMRWALLVLR